MWLSFGSVRPMLRADTDPRVGERIEAWLNYHCAGKHTQ